MARVSKHVYYNIEESDIELQYKDIILYFSSDFNRERFQNRIVDFVNDENFKLKAKYNVEVELSKMLILSYYSKIEKRGFRAYEKVVNIKNNENKLIRINKSDIITSKVGE